MKVLTWNINGVRAVQRDKNKTNLKVILDSLKADVVCLQETKVTRDMLDEPTAVVDGYESYFSFSRKKSGYSGTANYCKTEALPNKAEEGLTGKLTTPNETCVHNYGSVNGFSDEELHALDEEGRCVITQHRIRLSNSQEKEVAIINVYVPRAGDREDRHKYKLQFLTLLQIRAEALLKNGIHVIILGDINTTHRQIDNCDPDEEFFRKSSRIWLNRLLQHKERDKNIPMTDADLSDIAAPSKEFEDGYFSDVFRQLHPLQENCFTNWCTLTGARQTNFGRRLDYILIDTELAAFVTNCEIMSDIEGSDHCPVIVTLNCTPISSSQSPLLCSKFMPEFKGQQKKLSSFFTKSTKPSQSSEKEKSSLSKDQHFSNSKNQGYNNSTVTENGNIQRTQTIGGLKRQATAEVDQRSLHKKGKLKKGSTSTSDSKQVSLTSFFSQRTIKSDCNKKHNSQTQHKNNSNTSNSNFLTTESALHTNPPPVVTCFVIEDNDDQMETNLDTDLHESIESEEKMNSELKGIDTNSSVTAKYSISNSEKPAKVKSQPCAASAWKGLLGGLPPPPLCPGHKEACVLRKVKKAGPNQNKQFYVCARPDGASGNPNSRCDFFQWLTKKK